MKFTLDAGIKTLNEIYSHYGNTFSTTGSGKIDVEFEYADGHKETHKITVYGLPVTGDGSWDEAPSHPDDPSTYQEFSIENFEVDDEEEVLKNLEIEYLDDDNDEQFFKEAKPVKIISIEDLNLEDFENDIDEPDWDSYRDGK